MNRKASCRLLLAVPLLMVAGCAGAGGSGASGSAAGSSRDVLTEEDLAQVSELNVFEAIRRLRPSWFRTRGQSFFSPDREGIRIYMDDVYFGEAQALENVMVWSVQEVRFLDSRQATLRFGTGHTVGAIVLTSKKG